MEIYMIKKYGTLTPCSEEDAEKLMGMKDGLIKCEVSNPRNGAFHCKYFALLDVLYNMWSPPEEIDGHHVAKSRTRFRKDIAIVTGHRDMVVNIKNEVRYEAKSISFAKMSQEDFERLYSDTINYGLAKIQGIKGVAKAKIDNWVSQILSFD